MNFWEACCCKYNRKKYRVSVKGRKERIHIIYLTFLPEYCAEKWSIKFTMYIYSQIFCLVPIPHICHRHHRRCLWRIFLPCGEISSHDRLSCGKILHMTDCHVENSLHMRNVKKICNMEKLCVQFMVFCRIKLL